MRKGRSRRGLSKRALPDSLTRHLFDPRVRIAKTPDGQKCPRQLMGSASGLAILVAILIIVWAAGYLVEAW